MSARRKDKHAAGNPPLVPYRDSALTKLLADSLGGSALCLILACVSPSMKHLEETKRTLAFACRARSIKNSPVVQMDPQDKLIQDLKVRRGRKGREGKEGEWEGERERGRDGEISQQHSSCSKQRAAPQRRSHLLIIDRSLALCLSCLNME